MLIRDIKFPKPRPSFRFDGKNKSWVAVQEDGETHAVPPNLVLAAVSTIGEWGETVKEGYWTKDGEPVTNPDLSLNFDEAYQFVVTRPSVRTFNRRFTDDQITAMIQAEEAQSL